MTTHQTKLSPRAKARLAAYAAVAGTALAAPVLPSVQADIIYSGPLNLAVPNTTAGIYLNFVTRTSSTTPTTGYDFNPYSSSGSLSFYFPTGSGGLSLDSTTLAVLPKFSYIGSFATFLSSIPTDPAFRAGETGGYVGLKFLNESTGATDYGWVSINTTGTTGLPATITGYAYENTGQALPAGVIPEPGTTALLGAMAVGAVGIRQWRRRQTA